jgi:hypothetical protein
MKARIEFQPRDLWVGLFWKLTNDPLCLSVDRYGIRLQKIVAERTKVEVWLCIIPCFPLHVTFHMPGAAVSD